MKTRNGFVSNSSSSSFLIIVKEEAFYKAIKDKLDWEKEILNKMFQPVQILGLKCFEASYNKCDEWDDWKDFREEYFQQYKKLNGINEENHYADYTFSKFSQALFNSIPAEDKFTRLENW